MSQNDFAPPESDVTEREHEPTTDFELARRDQRAAGLILDLLITYPLSILLMVLPNVLGLFVLLDIELDLMEIPRLLSWMVTLLAYYLLCESIWQRTIGKLITGTRVVTVAGTPPSIGQVFVRTLIRFIPLEFITYLDGNRTPAGWHDRWSQTRVIKISR